ncbi:hypothetical protein JQC91_02575 [Jannaschia sp. Os4]|uniref:hypothetical protein n=1 Tax=Jannaschia sp. Os4 TaxID=2807617 RepID=UPI00193AC29C|nr:hypothetical protein [Jannaschia sp. Os4]MBM2575179.1 hypothetical protein [Jannaschia sp. Os4]
MRATIVVILAALALAVLGGLPWRGGTGSVAEARFEGPLKTLFLAGHGPVTVPLGTVQRGVDADGRLRLVHVAAAHGPLLVRPGAAAGARVRAGADDAATARAAAALAASLDRAPRADEPGLAPDADLSAALSGPAGPGAAVGPDLRAVAAAMRAAAAPARLMGRDGAWIGVGTEGADLLAPVDGACVLVRAADDPLPARWSARGPGGPEAGPVAWVASGPRRAFGRTAEGHLMLDLRRAGRLDLLCATTSRDPLALALHARHLRGAALPDTSSLPDAVLARLRAFRSVEPLGDALFSVLRDDRPGLFVLRPDGTFVSGEGWLSAGWLPAAGAIVVERRAGPGRTSPNDRGLLHPDGTLLVGPDYYDLGDVPGRPGVVRMWRGGETALYSVPERRLLPPDG